MNFIFIFFHLRFIDHEVLVDFLCQWRHLTTASLTTRHQASEIQRPPSYILIDPSGYFCSVWSKSLRNLLLFRSLLFPKVFILQFRNFFTDSMPLVIDSLLSIFIVRKRLFLIMKLCDFLKYIVYFESIFGLNFVKLGSESGSALFFSSSWIQIRSAKNCIRICIP